MSERRPVGTQVRRGVPIAGGNGTAQLATTAALSGLAGKALDRRRPGIAAHLRGFPGGEAQRDRSPSRDIDL